MSAKKKPVATRNKALRRRMQAEADWASFLLVEVVAQGLALFAYAARDWSARS